MSRLEQDQEKLMNAAAQVAQNLVSTAAHLSSLKKSPTKLNIKTAIDEVQNTQKLLKKLKLIMRLSKIRFRMNRKRLAKNFNI